MAKVNQPLVKKHTAVFVIHFQLRLKCSADVSVTAVC